MSGEYQDALAIPAIVRETLGFSEPQPDFFDTHALFEVHESIGGHVWRVFADGRIEGFPPGSLIVNRAPAYKMLDMDFAES